MWARHYVGDDLCFRRIRHGRFQHANDSGGARTQPHGLAEHRRVALQSSAPEPVRQHHGASGLRSVVAHIEQPAEHGVQAHHREVRSTDHSRSHFSRLSQSDHGEADRGEVAKLIQ